MRRHPLTVSFLLSLLLAAPTAHAVLNMSFNLAEETFSFSGSTTLWVYGASFYMTNVEDTASSPNQSVPFGPDAITVSNDTDWAGEFGYNTNFGMITGLFAGMSTANGVVLTGTGVSVSYAALGEEYKTIIESWATGESPQLYFANGAQSSDSIGVTASPVPEPSSYAMGMAIAVLGFLAWQRRRA